MKINNNTGKAVISVDILDINSNEMYQMCTMRERIEQVLKSHSDKNTKNEYLSDDELKTIYAMLRVFTKGHERITNSAFDDMLKEIDVESKPKSIRTPDDDLFGGSDNETAI